MLALRLGGPWDAWHTVRTRRRRTGAETFAQLADLYMEKHAKVRKKSWRTDQRLIDVELLPVLGLRKVYDITRSDARAG